MYVTDRSSPFVPGERPSNSSDARTLMCASRPSGVIASSAGCRRSFNSSFPARDAVADKKIASNKREIFMLVLERRFATIANLSRDRTRFLLTGTLGVTLAFLAIRRTQELRFERNRSLGR